MSSMAAMPPMTAPGSISNLQHHLTFHLAAAATAQNSNNDNDIKKEKKSDDNENIHNNDKMLVDNVNDNGFKNG